MFLILHGYLSTFINGIMEYSHTFHSIGEDIDEKDFVLRNDVNMNYVTPHVGAGTHNVDNNMSSVGRLNEIHRITKSIEEMERSRNRQENEESLMILESRIKCAKRKLEFISNK